MSFHEFVDCDRNIQTNESNERPCVNVQTASASRATRSAIRLLCRTLDDETSALIRGAAMEVRASVEDHLYALLIDVAEGYRNRLGHVPPRAYEALIKLGAVGSARGRPARSPEETEEVQEAYLVALRDTCDLEAARATVGIAANTPYTWARTDAVFLDRWNSARVWAGIRPFEP